MITRELIKAEIDKAQEKNLEIIYRIIQAIESPSVSGIAATQHTTLSWQQFIEKTYGSLANDPIERGEQGQYETREAIL